MGRLLNSSQIWSQVPVASRTVEVNTKTGFSLTAGSYSVRASSTQTGIISINGATSVTATISSVTTTRASLSSLHFRTDATTDPTVQSNLELTNATTVTGLKVTSTNNSAHQYQVMEFF